MAKAKAKKPTVKDMVNTMLEIVESQDDLIAGVTITKRDVTKMIKVNRENQAVLQGMTKAQLQDTYNSLIGMAKTN